jgi:hypothetical protein
MGPVKGLLSGILGLAMLASACTSSGGASGGQSQKNSGPVVEGGDQIAAEVASYDLAVGRERFIVGLFTRQNLFVDYGTAKLSFFYLGTKNSAGKPSSPAMFTTGHFISVAKSGTANPPSRPEALPASKGRGVYGARVSFDKPGFWQVKVTVDVKGMGRQSARAAFQVFRSHEVPFPGQPALKTDNLTMSSDAPKVAIDSRAQGNHEVPDPALHRTTIAESIARHQPAVVVFATPVYCISRFCGPTVDMIEALAHRYSDRANFIHVEIWHNYRKHEINRAAADWLYHGGELHEPWVFLIGANGKIVARWDNVVNASELVPYLKKLPKLKG